MLGLLQGLRPIPRPSIGNGPGPHSGPDVRLGATGDGSHVHHTTVRPGRRPALPRQHRHRLRRSPSAWPPHRSGSPASESTSQTFGRSCAAPRPRSARLRAGTTITGLQPLVHSRYTVWSRLPGPARLAVPCRPDVVGAACRPHRRSPAQAAPSFTQAAATARRRRIHTSARSCDASWRTPW